MNKKIGFVFALLLAALPFLIAASRTAPPPRLAAGELELFFPAGSATAGGFASFSVPFQARPVVVVSANSQNYGRGIENAAGVPTLDYFSTSDGISVLAALDSPVAVDTVFTVSWIATLPNP